MCETLGLVVGSTWLGPGSTCAPITPPEPVQNESGACMLSMAGLDGVCFDVFPEGVYNKPYNMTRILCGELADIVGSPQFEYLPDTRCSDLTGACRIERSPELPITEGMCTQTFGDTAVWSENTCCISGQLSADLGGVYVNQDLCESIPGVFSGIGSTCMGSPPTTQPPISTPEYPSKAVPLFVMLFAAGMISLMVKR